jgi:hypothetical protein
VAQILNMRSAPGTIVGAEFDEAVHCFHNASFAQLRGRSGGRNCFDAGKEQRFKNLTYCFARTVGRLCLGGHMCLAATSHSKSLLRAVAGELAGAAEAIDYFPSYEIITHPVFRGMFFAPNMRAVVPEGVATVMRHFFEDQRRVFGEVVQSSPGKRRKKNKVRSGK